MPTPTSSCTSNSSSIPLTPLTKQTSLLKQQPSLQIQGAKTVPVFQEIPVSNRLIAKAGGGQPVAWRPRSLLKVTPIYLLLRVFQRVSRASALVQGSPCPFHRVPFLLSAEIRWTTCFFPCWVNILTCTQVSMDMVAGHVPRILFKHHESVGESSRWFPAKSPTYCQIGFIRFPLIAAFPHDICINVQFYHYIPMTYP